MIDSPLRLTTISLHWPSTCPRLSSLLYVSAENFHIDCILHPSFFFSPFRAASYHFIPLSSLVHSRSSITTYKNLITNHSLSIVSSLSFPSPTTLLCSGFSVSRQTCQVSLTPRLELKAALRQSLSLAFQPRMVRRCGFSLHEHFRKATSRSILSFHGVPVKGA